MKTAAVIFALAAVGGLTLAFLRLNGAENPPTWMAIGHGVVAAAALVSLIVVAAQSGLPAMAKAALVVFVAAAAGGIYLFVEYQLAERLLPMPLVSLHGGLAVTGFGLLLAAIYGHRMVRSR
jgi:hypothetical protein